MSHIPVLDQLCINTIRVLSIDAVEHAASGHPGMPMGAATMAYVLWTRHLRHDPADPKWPDRDRFVLSAGHGSMLLYSLLHLTGYDLTLDDLKHFRRWGSRTPGHPERDSEVGIEVTTGPLGQGVGNAAGLTARIDAMETQLGALSSQLELVTQQLGALEARLGGAAPQQLAPPQAEQPSAPQPQEPMAPPPSGNDPLPELPGE